MNLRTAKKVRELIDCGKRYRKSTVERSRRRLSSHGLVDDSDLAWCRMMDDLKEGDPIGFARLQFKCAMNLIADGYGDLLTEQR